MIMNDDCFLFCLGWLSERAELVPNIKDLVIDCRPGVKDVR